MYYPNDSLKHNLCVRGNELLYKYALEKKIPHKKNGKYIIASSKKEIPKLEKIYELGKKNKVKINKISKCEILENEPELDVECGLFSPNSGLIDVPEFINSLEIDINKNEGIVAFNTEFEKVILKNNLFRIFCRSSQNFHIESKILINASGLESYKTSNNIEFLNKKYIYKLNYAKGHYYKYSGKNPFKKLIYPIGNEESLGIHVGMDLEGYLRFGPDIEWVDKIDYSFKDSSKKKFVDSIKTYWPNICEDKLHEDYVGIRPKIQNKNEKMKDFSILSHEEHGIKNFINLQGIESPGLTSSLAIGELVSSILTA